MLCSIMTQTCNDGLVMVFGLAVCLQVVRSGLKVFHLKERTERLKSFAHKLGTIFHEDKGGNHVWCSPLIEENRPNLPRSGFDAGTAQVSFVYRFVMMKMNLFPVFFWAVGPKFPMHRVLGALCRGNVSGCTSS